MTKIIPIACGMVNCYLLQGPGGSVLVDAGNAGDAPRLEKALRAQGLAPAELKLLLLTHNHPDHTGAAAHFRARHSVPLALHPADAGAGKTVHGRGVRGALLGAFSRGAVRSTQPLEPDVELADGMPLAGYGIEGRVLAVPGHTAGSAVVLLDDGRLIAGDMYMNMLGAGTAYIAEDFAALDASHARLRSMGVGTVWPGHGRPFQLR